MFLKHIKRIEKFVVLLITFALIAFAIYYRFKNLGLSGLSCDEYITGAVPHFINKRCYIFAWIMNSFSSIIVWISGYDFVPEGILRLPQALISIFTIPILWFIGKNIKDKYVAILLITFFAFSHYLITYARDARFYPFYFIGSSLVYLFVIKIFDDKFKTKLNEYIIYSLYSISMIFTIGNHQGALLLYATTNIFLFFYITIQFVLSKKRNTIKRSILDLSIKLFIISIPLIANLWHLYKISRGEMGTIDNVISANNLNSVGKLLPELSWNNLVSLQKSFWQLQPYSDKALIITTIASIVLLAFKRTRIITLYFIFIKWGTFVLLRLLPQAVVKEPLREKYILFILVADFIVISTFLAEILSFLSSFITSLFKNYKTKILLYRFLYVISIVFILFYISDYDLKGLQKSNIHKSRNLQISNMACALDSVNNNDIIISYGHFDGLNNALPYEKRRLPTRNNWNLYIEPTSFNSIMPSKSPGYVWYVFGETTIDAPDFVREVYNEGALAVYRSHYKISNNITNITILTSHILQNSTSKLNGMNAYISSSQKFNPCVDIIKSLINSNYYSVKLSKNMLNNSDFSSRMSYWKKRVIGLDGSIKFGNDGHKSFITLDGINGAHFGLTQILNITSGEVYRVSATGRASKHYDGKLPGGYIMLRDNKAGKEQFIIFYDTSKNWTKKTIRYRAKSNGTLQFCPMVGYGSSFGSIDFTELSFCKELQIDYNE